MLVDTSHGKMKINLLANEPDNTPNEYGVRYDNATCCTAGLITDLQKFKDMHIRETMNSDPSVPSFPDNPTPSRRPQYWQTTPVGFSMYWQSLRYRSQQLIFSGNHHFRAIQRIFKIFSYTFRQQTLQKPCSLCISQDPIPFFLYFTAPLLIDSGMMDYIIVIPGLPVFALAFLLWPVDGATISVSYQMIQSGKMGNWIGGKQAVSILN
jgi:hypothetical protein